MLVPLRQGEIYEIWVKNTTTKPVMMRLLVDGLNTLPEPVRPKAMGVEAKDRPTTYLPAQRSTLLRPRPGYWDAGEENAVRGFFSETGEKGEFRAFKVVDAPHAVAAMQGFPDQIGCDHGRLSCGVTYEEEGRLSRLTSEDGQGTGFGPGYKVPVNQYEDYVIGDLLAVIHIRYGEGH